MNIYNSSNRERRFVLTDSNLLAALGLAALIQIVLAFSASSNVPSPMQATVTTPTLSGTCVAGPVAGLPATNSSAIFHSPAARG